MTPLEILAGLLSPKSTAGLVRDAGKRVDAAVDSAVTGAPAVAVVPEQAPLYTPGSDYKPLAGPALKAYQDALAAHLRMGARVRATAGN